MSWYAKHGVWLHGALVLIGAAWMLLAVLGGNALTAVAGACLALSQSLALYDRRNQPPDRQPQAASSRLGRVLVAAGAALVVAVLAIALTA